MVQPTHADNGLLRRRLWVVVKGLGKHRTSTRPWHRQNTACPLRCRNAARKRGARLVQAQAQAGKLGGVTSTLASCVTYFFLVVADIAAFGREL